MLAKRDVSASFHLLAYRNNILAVWRSAFC